MVFNFTHQNWLVLNSCFFNQSWHPVIPLPNYTLSLSESFCCMCVQSSVPRSLVGKFCWVYRPVSLLYEVHASLCAPLMIQCFFVMFLSISILISSSGGSPHLLAFCLIRRLFLVVHMYFF